MLKYLKWDLSPLRPHEWEETVAEEWNRAEKVQAEWRAGEQDAESFLV